MFSANLMIKRFKLFALFLVFISTVNHAQQVEKVESGQLFLDFLELIENIHQLYGRNNDHDRFFRLQQSVTEQVNSKPFYLDKSTHQSVSTKLEFALNLAQEIINDDSQKLVEFPDPSPLPECTHVEPRDVEVALGGKLAAEEVLAAVKWICHETVFGENNALACEVPEILVNVVKAEFEFGEFCLGNKGETHTETALETIRSVGEHLNEYLDETITSRATQESLDTAQDSIDTVQDSVDDANNGINIIDGHVDTLLANVNQANVTLATIHSQANSLLQRAQVNQIEIENIELITSDLQQLSLEIRNDTQAIIQKLQTLQNQLTSQFQQTQLELDSASQSSIEFTLARNPNLAQLSYQLPGSKGGKLETVREILTQKMAMISQLGGDISAVQKYLTTGDNFYNNQQFKSAYYNYSLAYKALLQVSF